MEGHLEITEALDVNVISRIRSIVHVYRHK